MDGWKLKKKKDSFNILLETVRAVSSFGRGILDNKVGKESTPSSYEYFVEKQFNIKRIKFTRLKSNYLY